MKHDRPDNIARSPTLKNSHASCQHLEAMPDSNLTNQDRSKITSQKHHLSPSHPATSVNELLETCGPLIFPLHRAALLRKRVLFLCSPPLRKACDIGLSLPN